ncbi:LysR family transcriptional regulator [uncultured Tateyamaria sp.]|uniref:LysR family transcriptional regulator n=1 Tax=Tateyamaria sp. 1078 TaxID=3417464 RepID=UPI00262B2203|nr:LysR family transcriptional regulator [uncultured Tateyamaria sp.]
MSRLKLEHLQTFLAVARYGSVSRAAEALNLTQPTATSRIKAMEASLGTKVFDRTATGMSLTKRGDMLLQYAAQFQQLSDMVEENVMDAAGVDRLMRIGVSETIAQSWLPDFIGALHKDFPNLKIEISVDISLNLREQLLRREVDLAILLGPISDFTVDNIELPSVELVWFRAAGEGRDVDLRTTPIATYARNTRPFRELRAKLFDRFGPDITLFPSSSLSSCFRMVEAGLAVGALPKALGRSMVEAGKLVEFDAGVAPSPLNFSASYIGEPRNYVIEAAAKTAQAIAAKEL